MHAMRRSVIWMAPVLALSAFGADAPAGNISVTGEAMICVVPDEALVSVGVESFHAGLDNAKQINDVACASLLKAVKGLGVEEKHVRTDVLDVELRYRDGSHPSQGIEGYYVRRAYTVTLKDIKLFEKLVDTALKNGANRLMGFEFRSTEMRKHRDEARAKAIQAAKEKGAALAAEMDNKLGKIRNIGEGHYGYSGAYRSWGGWGGGWQQASQNYVSHAGDGGSGGETAPLGEIGIRASVNVTFELSEK